MHYLMVEFYSLDDVGQSYDTAQREDRAAVKFGRHPNDFMTVVLHAHAVGIPD
jgi:hypothetical protein